VTPLDVFSLASGVVAVVRHYLPSLDLDAWRRAAAARAEEIEAEIDRLLAEIRSIQWSDPGTPARPPHAEAISVRWHRERPALETGASRRVEWNRYVAPSPAFPTGQRESYLADELAHYAAAVIKRAN
jgi:hypothetical protein